MISVVVIGEACVDCFVYGDCKRLSPEAPVPVMSNVSETRSDGMSGNVVRNLLSLDPTLSIHHAHQREGIEKTRYVDRKSNHMFLRVDHGDEAVGPMELTDGLIGKVRGADILIVSDYDKGFLTDGHLVALGRSAGLSILDSKRRLTREIVDCYSFVKLNEQEMIRNSDLGEPANIITTLGERGAMLRGRLYPAKSPRQTMDVSGAGDTFTASFILKYFETKDVGESIGFANEMSSLVVSRRGVVTPW